VRKRKKPLYRGKIGATLRRAIQMPFGPGLANINGVNE
jgi:hypothetical protein